MKLGVYTVVVIVSIAVMAADLVGWSVHRAIPGYPDTMRLPGLGADVTVYRDGYGIPQVYASSTTDLFRAQGYLHAQERFWEMDFRRHVTAGRLSELFGSAEVETDSYLRTMGWRRVAEQEWSLISPQSRQFLTAYAEGVNSYLVDKGVLASRDSAGGAPNGTVSLEYTVLALQNPGYRIERWDPVDGLAWLKAMAWDLRGNMDDETDRAALLAAGLSRDQIAALYPPYPFDRNKPIVDSGSVTNGTFNAAAPAANAAVKRGAPEVAAVDQALTKLLGPGGGNGIGSNSWVIGGDRTTTGKPILANDPHLSPSAPGIWMQMGLHCTCGFDVEGYTFSTLPGVVIGHNGRIAWGFTNLNPDVTDFYLEKLDGDRYQVDGVWKPLDIRHETIKVAGGKPVDLTVRTTDNGPLLSDASADMRKIWKDDAVALKWTALTPGRTVDALFDLDSAQNWTDFRHAASEFEVPAQNMVYADVDGNIGYQAPGRIPIRGKGDGTYPAPGWDSAYDWTGYLPFDELPNAFNPAKGYVVTANNAVIGPQYQPFLTDDWSYGYRSQRIADLITAGGKVSVADVQKMQFDNRNNVAPLVVPALLAVPGLTGTAAKAQQLLRGWDFQQGAGSAPAAYFNAVWKQMLARTFDELPADYKPTGGDRWFEVVRQLLKDPSSAWWDNRSTPAVEHESDILTASMTAAVGDLPGGDPSSWKWGDVHTLTLQNGSFGTSGIAPLEWLFNSDARSTSGGPDTVNATGWDATADGFTVNHVPSMRMIVDLSNLDGSRWVSLSGVSGHAFAPHYLDQFDLWRTGQTLPMPWSKATIQKDGKPETMKP
jgi:penicillin amidase